MAQSPLSMEVTCQEVHQKLEANEDFLLLDCREVGEYEIAKIDQALLLPMNELPTRISELEPHRNNSVIVHCHHGGRSLRVANWLREQGFSQAQSMAGGIDAWATEIEPNTPRY